MIFVRRRVEHSDSRGTLNVDARIYEVVRCMICNRVLAVRIEAVAWIDNHSNKVTSSKVEVFENYEKIVLRHVRGVGNVSVATLCSRCYNDFMNYVNQVLRDLRSFVATYTIASVDGIDKFIEFRSVEEMKRFVKDCVEWMTDPALRYVETALGIEDYAIATTAMLRTTKDGKPLIAELYVPATTILDEMKGGDDE